MGPGCLRWPGPAVIIWCMGDLYSAAMKTLGEHLGPATWALGVFFVGFVLAFPVVRLEVTSLLALPRWFMRIARKHLGPGTNPTLLCLFIFAFNTSAILLYMISGGLVFLPMVFGLFTGLNVGAALLLEAREPEPDDTAPIEPPHIPRAWVGLCGLFVVAVELSAFWLALGMGMKLGHLMRQEFTWQTFALESGPRLMAYFLVLTPALFVSAIAETAAIKGMLGAGDQ
jgi:stage II sporulation SpoM-like protein